MKIESVLQKKGIINKDPEIMSGAPVFAGSRVPLQTFFDYLEGEEGLSEFINDFPYLESQAVRVLETVAKMTSLREELKEGAIRRGERDFNLAREWFDLEEEIWQKTNN